MAPGKGDFVAIGDGAFAGGYRQTVDGWYLDNVPGTQANVPLSRLGVGAAVPTLWVSPRPGSLTAVCVTSTEARTAGTLTVEVIKQPGGIGSNLTAVLDATNTTFKASTMNKDTFTFNAGESLTVWVTTVGWTPTTANIRVSIEVET